MEHNSEKKNELIIRPHKLKNLLFALLFAVLAIAFALMVYIAFRYSPETVAEKISNCLLFAVSLAGFIFMILGALDSIRNIFALPTFKVDSENIFICKYGNALLSELESTELKKNGKILVFNFKNGSSAVLRCRLSEIPLKTIEYKIYLLKNT